MFDNNNSESTDAIELPIADDDDNDLFELWDEESQKIILDD